MKEISIFKIKQRVQRVFENAGLSFSDAEKITEVLLDAEMKGIRTHGFVRVKKYVDCIRKGGIRPSGDIKILSELPSWAVVDGEGGLGILIALNAVNLAIQKAKETGIGIVNVKNSHHLGPVGYYAAKCADEKMFGMAMSNGDVMLAATGSREKNIGNNPFAYSVPAGKYDKIIYDVAISMGSDMKIIQMGKEGKKVPPGWMVDKNGIPSDNPSDYLDGGVLLPFGGYKGYGLALMVEMFAGVLSGSHTTKDVHAWNQVPGETGGVGHFFMAIDISKMGDVKEYEMRIEGIIDDIKASEKAQGASEIFYPGEIEKNARAKCMESGTVLVDEAVLEEIFSL
ncbi:MAG: Ldh family oxidoreductase [Clostridia bacterium]|nr:Ldh family oxidoreductase [Clostridia bacterium]